LAQPVEPVTVIAGNHPFGTPVPALLSQVTADGVSAMVAHLGCR
jgi:hypothetical protein